MKGKTFFIIALLSTLFASLLYVRTRFLVVELSFDLSKKQERREGLEEDRRALTLELATLKSPQRIERVARTQLGLTKTESAVPRVIVASRGVQ